MIDVVTRRRIELGMSHRTLAQRTGIMVGALKEAERIGSMEHLTLGQLHRIEKSLGLDLTHGACGQPVDELVANCWSSYIGRELLDHGLSSSRAELMETLSLSEAELDLEVEILRLRLLECGMSLIVERESLRLVPSSPRSRTTGGSRDDLESGLNGSELTLLIQIAEEERALGSWSTIANEDPPREELRALIQSEAVEVREGRVRISPMIVQSLEPVLANEANALRVANFSVEFAKTMTQSVSMGRR